MYRASLAAAVLGVGALLTFGPAQAAPPQEAGDNSWRNGADRVLGPETREIIARNCASNWISSGSCRIQPRPGTGRE